MAIDVPFTPTGSVTYRKYSEVERQIKEFDDVEVIGQDSSGQYNVYKIEMGKKDAPTLFITAVMHGTEYAGSYYLLSFLEDLRERRTMPTSFIDELLNNFRIVAIPVLNPYGLDNTTPYAVVQGRHPIHGREQNWEWNEHRFNVVEAQNARPIADDPHIFAYLDFHLIRSHANNNAVILGHGKAEDAPVRDEILDTMKDLFPDKKVISWIGASSKDSGLSRSYMANHKNLYTKNTLSYINEMGRPVQESESNGGWNEPLNPQELYRAGYYMAYLFVRTSMDYYYNNVGTGTYEKEHNIYSGHIEHIDDPQKEVEFETNSLGQVVKTFEKYKTGKYKDRTLISEIIRDSNGRVTDIRRSLTKGV